VVGPSGCGKSTLAALLLRFYDPRSGTVAIGGTDIKTLDPDWLRNNIGVVSQVSAWCVYRQALDCAFVSCSWGSSLLK